ncbi:MAG: EAL domain-containing protein [Tenericutes bacterium]|nr:EAL domain-containing protein [Mycoplasmatota bacterium]
MQIQLLLSVINNIFKLNMSIDDLVAKIFYSYLHLDSLKLVAFFIFVLAILFLIMSHHQKSLEYNTMTAQVSKTITYIEMKLDNTNLQKISQRYSFKESKHTKLNSNQKSMIEENTELIFMMDKQGNIMYANENALTFFNSTKIDVLGESIFKIYDQLEVNDTDWFKQVLREYTSYNIVKCQCLEEEKLVLINYHANLDTSGNVESIIATGNDVTTFAKSKVVKDFYQKQDFLTGIMNQYGLTQKLKEMNNSESAVAFFIEIMHYTQIVNYYGRVVVDKLLNEVVNELKGLANENSLVARYNECEFVLVFLNGQVNKAVIDSYKAKIEAFLQSSYQIGELDLQLDKRAGYAIYPEDSESIEEIVALSSIALKDSITKNTTDMQRYKKGMLESIKYNLELANKLKIALDDEIIQVFFQKAINCITKQTYVFEQLSRWHDEDLGYISPLDFFKIAKETNQLDRLDRYMVKKSLESFKLLKDTVGTNDAKLTINLAPNTLMNIKFFEYFDDVVKKVGLEPSEIYIEISEGTFINKLDLCISRINLYKSHGYLIALDDFGIEYSSLGILEKVNFDIIKLDAHFVRNISNVSNQEVIKMIRKITDMTDREMIAEGVETKEQSEKLRDLGCLIQQGYYLHKPEDLLH